MELSLTGARAEQTAYGVKFTVDGSGRELAYNRLRAMDATGKELTARLEVMGSVAAPAALGNASLPDGERGIDLGLDSDWIPGEGFDEGVEPDKRGACAPRLVVLVADANAVYPVRIDPTFSDANWVSLNPGIPGATANVNALAADESGNLYVGGSFAFIGTVAASYIAKWDGSTWSALGQGMNGGVSALAVSGTSLYVGGGFTTAGGVAATNDAKWDGSTWSALGLGMNGGVSALAVSGTNLYVGGGFTAAGGVSAIHIARWDGNTWSRLGSGLSQMWWGNEVGSVYALAVSGANLYAGGYFTNAGGVSAKCIAKWDGSKWSALGSGMNSAVWALAVDGTSLYAGGAFTTAGGVPANYIAKWNGSNWSALGSGVGPSYSQVQALAVSGTKLYAGGYFSAAGGVSAQYIAKWDGHNWSALCPGMNHLVATLAVSRTNLYAGGNFTSAGNVAANYIAKWDGSEWSALGSGVSNGSVYALAADGLGHLFVGGSFFLAGTNVSPCIAQANVGSGPTFCTPLQSQTVEDGWNVNLVARGTGDPPPTYQWFFNGSAITGCTTNADLCLSGVQATNAGTYTVVVSNCYGAKTSEPVLLNVIPRVERRPVPALNLLGKTGSALNVEYADALDSPTNWLPLDTVDLTAAPQLYLDVSSPLPPQRFYRIWQTGTPAAPPSLNLPFLVPAITLTGNIGDQLRLDCINQFGPTDAWVNLATVTLTNTSQLYFDLSAPGQPRRLYRIVPVP